MHPAQEYSAAAIPILKADEHDFTWMQGYLNLWNTAYDGVDYDPSPVGFRVPCYQIDRVSADKWFDYPSNSTIFMQPTYWYHTNGGSYWRGLSFDHLDVPSGSGAKGFFRHRFDYGSWVGSNVRISSSRTGIVMQSYQGTKIGQWFYSIRPVVE